MKLNNELMFKANEIYDVIMYGLLLLSSEFRSFELPASEFSPEQALRFGRVLSKGFSQCCESFGHLEFSSPPHPRGEGMKGLHLEMSMFHPLAEAAQRGEILKTGKRQTTVFVHLTRYVVSHLADNITISKEDRGQKELVTVWALLYGESHRI